MLKRKWKNADGAEGDGDNGVGLEIAQQIESFDENDVVHRRRADRKRWGSGSVEQQGEIATKHLPPIRMNPVPVTKSSNKQRAAADGCIMQCMEEQKTNVDSGSFVERQIYHQLVKLNYFATFFTHSSPLLPSLILERFKRECLPTFPSIYDTIRIGIKYYN